MNLNGAIITEVVNQGTPNFVACVPNDATVLTNVRGIYCVTGGTLQAQNASGVTVAIAMTAAQKPPMPPWPHRAHTRSRNCGQAFSEDRPQHQHPARCATPRCNQVRALPRGVITPNQHPRTTIGSIATTR